VHGDSGRVFSAQDVALAEDLARRAAVSVETAEAFRAQSTRLADVLRVAEAAQHAILAQPPARVGAYALGARYISAAAEALVGGDMYEITEREGAVRLLIGDVRGKGLPAVRTATIVLGEFRSAATQEPDLHTLAKRLDQQLRPWLATEEDFVTACLVDIAADGTFEVVSCGHPPPFHVAGGRWRPLTLDASPPLGMGLDPTPERGRLRAGERLLLYTDGLLEARTPDRRFFDPDALQVLAAHEPFDEVLDCILRELRAGTSEHLKDDLALLLVGYDPDPDPDADHDPRFEGTEP
jgi:serine phosphatase RsbU (regulator of sigma subunit)